MGALDFLKVASLVDVRWDGSSPADARLEFALLVDARLEDESATDDRLEGKSPLEARPRFLVDGLELGFPWILYWGLSASAIVLCLLEFLVFDAIMSKN